MNECLSCGKLVKNKYCNVSCQNRHLASNRMNKKYGSFKNFNVKCNTCDKIFIVNEREFLFPQKEKYYCSRICSNKRSWSESDKIKKSISLTKFYDNIGRVIDINQKCNWCGNEFNHKILKKHCSDYCKMLSMKSKGRVNGQKSSLIQSEKRRSKNEIYFTELCLKEYKNVRYNVNIFNGWDADTIIDDYRIAVLWNGNWHHKKITNKHSLEQVKNRDIIKINEIQKCGFEVYIINDYGKYDTNFVNNEFNRFKMFIETHIAERCKGASEAHIL